MNKTLSTASKLILAGGLLCVSAQASALRSCNTADVKITSVSMYSDTTSSATLQTIYSGSQAAADCAGAFAGNDEFAPTTNLGYAGDGLLNGGVQNGKNGGTLFPGGAFITPQYPLQDLDKDGQATDPGWIMLGKYQELSKNGPWAFVPNTIDGHSDIVTSSFFTATISTSGKGTWAFTPDATVAQRTSTILGRNYFDQFALVFKAGESFSVYDFTPDLFNMAPPDVDDPVMNWFGTYDVSGTLRAGKDDKNPAGLSHISLWVRDPAASVQTTTTQVPEPSTLALLGLSAAALIRTRRKSA
ncbi:MAG: PEP-CTERM sorting domain-containing protein [Proteobacteria bacterium]|nr:PEP-CTERM sorting domain-containing protein [Pseudomonadota bacterium]